MNDDEFSNYLHHLAHLDLPLEAKIETLRVLQEMMRSFVDRAFGDDPVGGMGMKSELRVKLIPPLWYPWKITTAQKTKPRRMRSRNAQTGQRERRTSDP